MTPEAIRKLFDYNYWAFERVWKCIMQLTDEQLVEDTHYSLGSVRNQVVHVMSATRRWMSRIEGGEVPAQVSFDDYTTREALLAQWNILKAETLDYIRSLDEARLNEVVHWEIPGPNLSGDHRRWELLLHVANHATDHRAQILAVLHLHFGAQTVEQDLLFYLMGME